MRQPGRVVATQDGLGRPVFFQRHAAALAALCFRKACVADMAAPYTRRMHDTNDGGIALVGAVLWRMRVVTSRPPATPLGASAFIVPR